MQLQFEQHELMVLANEDVFIKEPSQWWEYWYTLTDEIDDRNLTIQRDFMRLMHRKQIAPTWYKSPSLSLYRNTDNNFKSILIYSMYLIKKDEYKQYKYDSSVGIRSYCVPIDYFNLRCSLLTFRGLVYSYENFQLTQFDSLYHMNFYDAMFDCYERWGTKVQEHLNEVL